MGRFLSIVTSSELPYFHVGVWWCGRTPAVLFVPRWPRLAFPPPPPLVSFLPPQKFEEIYLKECAKSRPAPEAKFNYAWALIRSPARPDIRKGVIMMSGLLEDRFSDRDCLYYMAHGHYRLDDVVVCGACTCRWNVGGAGGVKGCVLDVGEGLRECRRVVSVSLRVWGIFPSPVACVST